jgi:hypothetical protein
MACLSEAETSLDVSEAEGSVIPDTPQEPSEPLAKFVIPGINVAVFPSKIGYVLRKCFSVLKIIKDAQGQHGLRYGDYQRYRHNGDSIQCS